MSADDNGLNHIDDDAGNTGLGWQHGSSWGLGLVLILLGAVFLLNNLTDFHLQNWWALFILIPAFGALNDAWARYRHSRRITGGVRSSALLGLFLTTLSFFFLLDISLSLIWPVFLILLGINLLFSSS